MQVYGSIATRRRPKRYRSLTVLLEVVERPSPSELAILFYFFKLVVDGSKEGHFFPMTVSLLVVIVDRHHCRTIAGKRNQVFFFR
jgi:hypothetical protein